MNEAFKDKWVAALRSGKYKQCKEMLYDGRSYCCLGVAECLADAEFERRHDHYLSRGESSAELTLETRSRSGISHSEGGPVDDDQLIVAGIVYRNLDHANDEGRTFDEIADAIEANWERL